MIKVALCDDDLTVLDELSELLGRYGTERNQELSYRAFNSPFELMAEIEKGMRTDIILLDIIMPGENGIDVAREIRKYDANVKIIFLTSSAELVVSKTTCFLLF